MKKTRIMSNVAFVFFIISLVTELLNDIFFYSDFPFNKLMINLDYISQNFFTFTLPAVLGISALIIGVKLASSDKTPYVYPVGYLCFATGYFIANFDAREPDVKLRNAVFVIAFILLALDGFIRPRVKVMGIIGAAGLYLVSLIFYIITFGEVIGSVWDVFNGNFSWFIEMFVYYSTFRLIAIGALIYVIGRQPRVARTPQAPQTPNNYQQNYQQYYPQDDQQYYSQDDQQYYPQDNQQYYPPNNDQYYPPEGQQDNNQYPY